MPRVAAADPIRDFKFIVEITPPEGSGLSSTLSKINTLGFAVVSGVSVQNEVIPYREGGMNTHPHKMVGQSDFAPVTFSRGTFVDQDQMWRWQQFLHAWSAATPSDDRPGAGNLSTSGNNDYRCTIGVRVLDHPASGGTYIADPSKEPPADYQKYLPTTRTGFVLYNCWPGAFAMSDLNAGNSGILIQQLTVHHEGFTMIRNNAEYRAAMRYL